MGSTTPRQSIDTSSDKPRNVCDMFWTSGSCDRAFDCTFQHLRGTTAPAGRGPDNSESDGTSESEPEDDCLAPAAEPSSKMTPTEVHNNLKIFLDAPLRTAPRIQAFVRLLGSVRTSNKSWVCSAGFLVTSGTLICFNRPPFPLRYVPDLTLTLVPSQIFTFAYLVVIEDTC